MELQEWINFGIDNNYLIRVDGKFRVTNNLSRVIGGESNLPALVPKAVKKKTSGLADVEELYHKFIVESKVPTRISNGRGGWYNGNRFSKKAADEFGRVILKGINYEALVLSTRLYYETTKECAVTITNYIIDGGWRTKYSEVMQKAQTNTLAEHIQKEISDGNSSNVESI